MDGLLTLLSVETPYRQAQLFELFKGSKGLDNIRLYQKHGYVISHNQLLSPGVELVFLQKPAVEWL